MDESVKLFIKVIELAISRSDPIWVKGILVLGLIIWFIVLIGVVGFVITFVAEEAKRFSAWIHS